MSDITVTVPDQHLSRAIRALAFQYENCIQAMHEAEVLGHGTVVDSLDMWAMSLSSTFDALRASVPADYKYYEYVVGDPLPMRSDIITDYKEQLKHDAEIAAKRSGN